MVVQNELGVRTALLQVHLTNDILLARHFNSFKSDLLNTDDWLSAALVSNTNNQAQH